jgi:hypothetical protein
MQIEHSAMPLLARAPSLMAALRRFFSAPSASRWVLVFAMLLMLPTLTVGLLGDDFLFRELLRTSGMQAHPGALFGLFTFSDGLPEHNRHMRDIGLFPWWAAENAKMNFWRPLSELTHWLDFALWPSWPVLMHVHSVAWYGLLVFLLGRLYKQIDPNPMRAHVSMLVFAVSTMHMLAVVWLAARNQLISACFIVLCLSLHHRWRQGGSTPLRWGAVLCFGLGLASAEAGLAALAYVVAYACFMDGGRSLKDRVGSVLPYLVLMVVWRHQYNAWGYGSAELGGYIDPGSDPGRFAHALALRLPTLLIAALTGVTSTVLPALPPVLKPFYATAAVAALAGMWLVSLRLGIWQSKALRFLAFGALLALVPVCAAEPNDRLLLNAELGLSAVLGTVFVKALAGSGSGWSGGRKGTRVLVWGAHVGSPGCLPSGQRRHVGGHEPHHRRGQLRRTDVVARRAGGVWQADGVDQPTQSRVRRLLPDSAPFPRSGKRLVAPGTGQRRTTTDAAGHRPLPHRAEGQQGFWR